MSTREDRFRSRSMPRPMSPTRPDGAPARRRSRRRFATAMRGRCRPTGASSRTRRHDPGGAPGGAPRHPGNRPLAVRRRGPRVLRGLSAPGPSRAVRAAPHPAGKGAAGPHAHRSTGGVRRVRRASSGARRRGSPAVDFGWLPDRRGDAAWGGAQALRRSARRPDLRLCGLAPNALGRGAEPRGRRCHHRLDRGPGRTRAGAALDGQLPGWLQSRS